MNEPESAKISIASRLRWAREQAGLSQGQAARLLNLHRPTISQIEAGQRAVKADELNIFAKLYGVDERWLLQGDSTIPDSDPRIQLAARELAKLKAEDLDAILRLLKVLKSKQD